MMIPKFAFILNFSNVDLAFTKQTFHLNSSFAINACDLPRHYSHLAFSLNDESLLRNTLVEFSPVRQIIYLGRFDFA